MIFDLFSLTATLSKLLESLIGRRLLPKIIDKLDPKQYGALRGRSTTHALVAVTHMWHQALDDHKSIRTLFVDYSKAFDHADHSIVLSNMTSLHAMCDTLDACVLIEPPTTSQDRVYSVPMDHPHRRYATGNMAGPYVFLMLIGDLQTMMTAYKFVDDVTISEVVDQSTSHMQLAAQQLAEWSKKNLMNINTKKTKEMMLG
jgi:hypothetical protein